MKAIVDTATIISDKVYNSLKHNPQKIKDVKLLTAGKEIFHEWLHCRAGKVKIGSKWYTGNLYVAPNEQQMLLGFDILCDEGQSALDMGMGCSSL